MIFPLAQCDSLEIDMKKILITSLIIFGMLFALANIFQPKYVLTNSKENNKDNVQSKLALSWYNTITTANIPFTQLQFLDKFNGWGISKTALWHTKDGGKNWTKVMDSSSTKVLGNPQKHIFNELQFINETTVWLLEGEHLLYTTDSGKSWKSKEIDNTIIRSFRFIDNKHGWAVGEVLTSLNEGENESWRGIAYRTADGGITWQEARLKIDLDYSWLLFDVYLISETEIWLVGDIVLHSTNGGKTWKQIEVESEVYGTPSKIQFANNNIGWITTNQGNKFLVTYDGGKTWMTKAVTMEGFNDLIYVSPLDAWVATNTGIYWSKDGGNIWNKDIDGRYFALFHLKSTNTLWASGDMIISRNLN